MPFRAVLLMAACGDHPANDDDAPDLTWWPCRTLCEDRADVYGQRTAGRAGATDRSAPGGSTGGYDVDEYMARCTAAPEDDRCETCSGWYFSDYLAPAGIAAAWNQRMKAASSRSASGALPPGPAVVRTR